MQFAHPTYGGPVGRSKFLDSQTTSVDDDYWGPQIGVPGYVG